MHWRLTPKTMEDVKKYLCRNCRYECQLCESGKSKADFPASTWKNRYKQKRLCFDCCRPRCTSKRCITCKVCRDEHCKSTQCSKQMEPLNVRLLPKTKAEVVNYLCGNCRHKCDVCSEHKSQFQFPASMWYHRNDKNRRCLCLNCCRPRCTSKHCKTCPTCRNPLCNKRSGESTKKRSRCSSEILPLHWQLLPKTIEDVQAYLCQSCRSTTCKCGKEMSLSMKRKRKLTQNTSEYVCADCQNRLLQASDKKHKTFSG